MQRCAALCLNIERQSKWPRTLVHRFTLMQLTPTINNSPGLMRRYATHIVMNGGMYLLNEQGQRKSTRIIMSSAKMVSAHDRLSNLNFLTNGKGCVHDNAAKDSPIVT
uniref:Secreted protein n=1 Tax=Ascaris lumbricoides TaxID=6252 RepID=A0A0M3HZH7_ASCLU